MQLELVLEASPEASQMLWEQFDPAQQEALIQRLALLIAKAAVAAPHAEEQGDEWSHEDKPSHLDRIAIVYVRQSTAAQVNTTASPPCASTP